MIILLIWKNVIPGHQICETVANSSEVHFTFHELQELLFGEQVGRRRHVGRIYSRPVLMPRSATQRP